MAEKTGVGTYGYRTLERRASETYRPDYSRPGRYDEGDAALSDGVELHDRMVTNDIFLRLLREEDSRRAVPKGGV